jgi:gamma-glutamylaminecyclotransferase
MHLFVYGTLKRGQPRHRFLTGQMFIAPAVTRPLYRMFNVGEYPALVRHADGRAIQGELWDVDDACVRTLDRVEGCDLGLYVRATVELSAPRDRLSAETYLYLLPIDGFADCGTLW